MIELKNVSKHYQSAKAGDVTALEDVNLRIAKGEVFGVIGKSGAGKSTLLRCVNLLEKPTSGSVKVNDVELTTLSKTALRKARHQIGMVFQHFNLLSTRSAYDNIALPLQLLHYSRSEIDRVVAPLLEITGMHDRRHAYPSQLSGGQKQRVAIARALATKPQVLLCDEMTSALDPQTTFEILKLIKNINNELKLSILLITHEMAVIKTIADQVAVIDHGRIVECDDVVNVFKNPKTKAAKNFVHTTLNTDLPKPLKQKLKTNYSSGAHAIVQLRFSGVAARQAVIDELIRTFQVRINIIQADLEFLQREIIGVMIILIEDQNQRLAEVLAYLKEKGLTVEVLGYVASDDWTTH